jgi:hypothetical protein
MANFQYFKKNNSKTMDDKIKDRYKQWYKEMYHSLHKIDQKLGKLLIFFNLYRLFFKCTFEKLTLEVQVSNKT